MLLLLLLLLLLLMLLLPQELLLMQFALFLQHVRLHQRLWNCRHCLVVNAAVHSLSAHLQQKQPNGRLAGPGRLHCSSKMAAGCAYLNGRTPECVSMWIFRFERFWNSFWQRGQLTTAEFRLCTSFECRWRAARDPSSFEHSLHWKSRSTSAISLCMRLMCTFSFCGWQNFRPQKSHSGRVRCGFALQPYVRCISRTAAPHTLQWYFRMVRLNPGSWNTEQFLFSVLVYVDLLPSNVSKIWRMVQSSWISVSRTTCPVSGPIFVYFPTNTAV
uniref:Secreted protein n=1 Tax=Anopheles farauti TaxID=69004 RepID=A0A182QHX0_9DIPT